MMVELVLPLAMSARERSSGAGLDATELQGRHPRGQARATAGAAGVRQVPMLRRVGLRCNGAGLPGGLRRSRRSFPRTRDGGACPSPPIDTTTGAVMVGTDDAIGSEFRRRLQPHGTHAVAGSQPERCSPGNGSGWYAKAPPGNPCRRFDCPRQQAAQKRVRTQLPRSEPRAPVALVPPRALSPARTARRPEYLRLPTLAASSRRWRPGW